MSFSLVEGLKCTRCGHEIAPEYLLECPKCNGLLDLFYALKDGIAIKDDSYQGMWKYHRVLPIKREEDVVTLGEGYTPLIKASSLAKSIGIRELWIKYEGSNPTGTVKDRTSSTAVSSARQFGFQSISVVSTGNAGVSIATYAKRGGLKSAIFCYERGDPIKMHHMGLMATHLLTYQGEYDDVIENFDRVMDTKISFDGGARRNPYKHEGKKTISYEIIDQLGRPPDYFFVQTSGCEIFISSYRGFQEIISMGKIDKMPTLVCCQSSHANPICRAFREGGRVVPMVAGPTIAKGMATGKPGLKGDRVLSILKVHDGIAIEVDDEEVLMAQRILAEKEGIWSGPTGAVSVASMIRAVRNGNCDPSKTFVCLVTETGLNSEYPRYKSIPIDATFEAIERVLRSLANQSLGGC